MTTDTITVYASNDYITISDQAGEILYWDSAEWKEDLTVTPTIANAIAYGYMYGGTMLRSYFKARK